MTGNTFLSTRIMSLLASIVTITLILTASAYADDSSAQKQIREVISSTYDKPDLKVETSPIVIADDYAVADWIQGNRGGRALLHRIDGQWKIAACGADDLKKVKTLMDAGIPSKTANSLVKQLATAEQSVSPEHIKRFSLFGTKDDPMTANHHDHPNH